MGDVAWAAGCAVSERAQEPDDESALGGEDEQQHCNEPAMPW